MSSLALPGRVCPCGSGALTGNCCGAVHADHASAATAEALMRARFSAFALGNVAFLRRSWAPETRPALIALDDDLDWIRLEIIEVINGSSVDDRGIVEFVAHYLAGAAPGTRRERSRFRRQDGRWLYIDGSR